MNELIVSNGKMMTKAEMSSFLDLVRAVFAFGKNEIDTIAIEHNTRLIHTGAQKTAFISFAESELAYMQSEDERTNFQKNSRLEKFNIISRKFNKEIRLAEAQEKNDAPLLPTRVSTEELFYNRLNGKLKASLRNMRALRDEAAIRGEYHKIIHLEDMRRIGLDDVDFSILSLAIASEIEKGSPGMVEGQDDIQKQEVPVFMYLAENGLLRGVLEKEINRRVLLLAARKKTISEFASDTSVLEERLLTEMNEIKDRLKPLFIKMDEVYPYIQYNYKRDWLAIKRWDSFSVMADGVKVKAFSEKEIKALELMGGWDQIIKIMDQGTLREKISKVFSNAIRANNESDISKMVAKAWRK